METLKKDKLDSNSKEKTTLFVLAIEIEDDMLVMSITPNANIFNRQKKTEVARRKIPKTWFWAWLFVRKVLQGL